MKISEIKKWAKEKGYEVVKDKEDGQYYWMKIDGGPESSGVSKSVSKVSTAIFNHLTENKFVDYQMQFQENLKTEIKFTVTDYGS